MVWAVDNERDNAAHLRKAIERAEKAERERDEARVKLGFTRTALRKAAETFHDFATTLRLLNHHLAADAAALAEKHTRAALEDSE